MVDSQNVTIDGRSGGVAAIGLNVYIGAGPKIPGGVKVGTGGLVGAYAVVVNGVPDRSMGGVPARIMRQNIESSDYERI